MPVALSEKNHYRVVVMAPPGTELDPLLVDDILQAAHRRRVVSKFDSGRGQVCWFEGPVMAALDQVREDIIRRARMVTGRDR